MLPPADGSPVPPPRPRAAILSFRWGSLGDLATAAFVLAALSGVGVAVPYDTADGYGSIATMLLANPAATFLRNLHYWSSQLCLVLTVFHIWDHLRARTEQHVNRGVWLRLSLTLPILIFIMLSGFMLRGDADAGQALRIVTEAITRVPLLGHWFATLAFGTGGRLDVIYVQHAATATILVWLFIIEHARHVWPRVSSFLALTLVTIALSLVLSPGLHNGLEPIVKGPWYFLGLQEILHWTPWPLVAVLGGVAIVALLYGLRMMQLPRADWAKRVLLGILVLYAGLCGVGALLRGESWAWVPTWPSGAGNLRAGWVFAGTPNAPVPLPIVMGRPEGCLVCHQGVTGLGHAHKPEAIGCASCHGGDTLTLDKNRAHRGMDLIPGNLATAVRGCGASACHASIVPRVERSVMTTMRGVVEINRRVFGEEAGDPRPPAHVKQLGHSPADTHLRQLCAACHLGATKKELGPLEEDKPGGGCNACHLVYSPAGLAALQLYERQKADGKPVALKIHPALSLDIDNGKCFGCHSRSGRISTNYEGWHELHEPSEEARQAGELPGSSFRTLADDRVFEKKTPDIHQQRGMDCIDCHTSSEVMGDGTAHARKSGQIRVGCGDCHAPAGASLPSVPAARLDPESRRILALRAYPGPAPKRFLQTARGDVLVNGVIDESTGRPVLLHKRNGKVQELKPAARVCSEGAGHQRLSCGTCHTAWAPRCTSCHTAYDAKAEGYDWVANKDILGAWKERSGPFVANLPTLGIRSLTAHASGPREVIDTFVPGMVLTIEQPAQSGRPAETTFRRLYARVEPHTTQRKARSCTSCHNDPEALGYGKGQLHYGRTAQGGQWTFTPALPPGPDGLPADAWIPFLGTRSGPVSTRDDVRPFSVEEQQKILVVGACLTCHDGGSAVMRRSVTAFKDLLKERAPRCMMPIWE